MTPDQEIRVAALRAAVDAATDRSTTASIVTVAKVFESYIKGPAAVHSECCPHDAHNHYADGCAFCDCADPYGRLCGAS